MKLEEQFSMIVAEAMNQEKYGGVAQALLDAALESGASRKQAEEAFKKGVIYSIDTHMSGCLPDSGPGYLAMGTDLKGAFIDEARNWRESYDDNDDNSEWDETIASLEDADASVFEKGASCHYPDNYILSLNPVSLEEICAMNEAGVDFSELGNSLKKARRQKP